MNTLARRWQPILASVALLAALLFPVMFPNALDTQMGVNTMMFVAAVVAWNIFSGYSGYISLGHAVFFGVGAYVAGLISLHNNIADWRIFLLLPLGGLAAAVVAVPFGLVALRVRRHTFVVITIAIFFIFQLVAFDVSWTGGINGTAPPVLDFSPNSFNNWFYYATLIIALLAIGLSWAIRGSRFGLQLLAIRDDEDRARGLGVKAMRVKLTAFVISGFFTGMVGGIFIFFIGQVYPQTAFDPLFDLTVALMAFLGGFGTLWGPLVGALILEPLLQEVSLQFTSGAQSQIIMGALFLLVILFMPRGLLPTVNEKLTAWRARQAQRRELSAPASGGGGSELAAAGAGNGSTAEGAR